MALFFALTIQAFAVKPYRIPRESMVPTLKTGQRILVDRFSHRIGGDPKLGRRDGLHAARTAPTSGSAATPARARSTPAARRRAVRARSPTSTKSDTTFVKRVVGMPGDTIAVVGGHVIRNGKRVSEPFACDCAGAECNLNPITIPKGTYFMMGDNRGNCDDSRFWGPVPRKWIIGKALVVVLAAEGARGTLLGISPMR